MGDTYEAALLTDYPWKLLDSKFIIDSGGGQGGLVLSLAKTLSRSQFLIEDLPEVVPLAQRNVQRSLPAALQDGRIQIQAHNLFHPRPKATENTVYILRYILHDWSDEDCIKILRNIQTAAQPDTKVLIIEAVVVPATVPRGRPPIETNRHRHSVSSSSNNDAVGIHSPSSAPNFIPANFGENAKMPLALGVHLMGAFNSYERTQSEWERVVRHSGLKIEKVNTLRAFTSVIECSIVQVDRQQTLAML